MITIRINAKTHEQTLVRADDSPAEDAVDALAGILARWIFEERRDQD